MKKITILTFLLVVVFYFTNSAQNSGTEKYGKTINLGIGIGYYKYTNHSIPVLHFNYEFDVAKSFTLAPFVTFYSYSNNYYWGNPKYPGKYYKYRETVIPIGVKGTYYFDKILNAGAQWDFYLAASLGFRIRSVQWDNDYYGDKYAYNDGGGLYLDFHVGTEYHFNNKIGMFLDLSSGVSTIGIAIHR